MHDGTSIGWLSMLLRVGIYCLCKARLRGWEDVNLLQFQALFSQAQTAGLLLFLSVWKDHTLLILGAGAVSYISVSWLRHALITTQKVKSQGMAVPPFVGIGVVPWERGCPQSSELQAASRWKSLREFFTELKPKRVKPRFQEQQRLAESQAEAQAPDLFHTLSTALTPLQPQVHLVPSLQNNMNIFLFLLFENIFFFPTDKDQGNSKVRNHLTLGTQISAHKDLQPPDPICISPCSFLDY